MTSWPRPRSRAGGTAAAPRERPVEVSVIVPCRNCARHLAQQLEALAGQVVDAGWEVVLVDNDSTDGSRSIAERFQPRLHLRIVEAAGRRGAGYARNAGASKARGDKLLFVDADDEVAPGYVSAMAAALDSAPFVTSRVDVVALNPEWSRSAHGPWQQEELLFLSPDFLPGGGANIGIRRAVFEAVGGFSEHFPGAAEEIAFAWTVQLAGSPLEFVPDAVYRYRHRETLLGLFRQTYGWGRSMPALYREFRAAGFPRTTLVPAGRAWRTAIGRLVEARSKAQLAEGAVELGYCVGRLHGSLRHRVAYL